ncbi:hypothetical protein BBF96_11805 [Anoxybacter fermentans]|uniref:Chemotaxis protein n=1 Tax=Anoxybacter fermentans TaxID=1323375 RepID=A0A3Q9HRD3_9FIRM|nr:methyl-accepting chemotaxis protein [Anoxybacter fermentans]AZR74017.1 hypothetical protein BBF96_11805 [Anoxybacter fermentans]
MLKFLKNSLRAKITVPTVLVLVILFLILGVVLYKHDVRQLYKEMEEAARAGVRKVNELSKEAKLSEEAVYQLNNDNAIALARMIAILIQRNPEFLNSEALKKLQKDLGVIDEIHIVDENGILVSGTHPEFFGFDFHSSEQSKVFLEGIYDPNFELAQEPQPRGADGVLFQYIGVGRLDKPGIVQVGIRPEVLAKVYERNKLENIIKRTSLGLFEPWVVDKEGNIKYHKNENFIGANLKDMGLFNKIVGKDEGLFVHTTFDGVRQMVAFKRSGDEYFVVSGDLDAALRPARELLEFFGIISLICLAITIVIMYIVIMVFVGKPIDILAKGTTKIAMGDLTNEIDINSNDEIGILAKNFNNMALNLRKIIDKIINTSTQVSSSSQELATITAESLETAQQIANTIEGLAIMASSQAEDTQRGADSIQKMADSLKVIMNNTKETLESITKVERFSNEGVNVVKEQLAKMNENKTSVIKVGEIIQSLARQTENIVKIVSTIQAISNQTNLLALNAAIEAARAGEYGRGFSVVADEVRSLAEETGRATTQVEEIINHIKENIEAAVSEMGNAERAVKAQEIAVDNTNKFFNEIHEMLKEITIRVNEIVEENEKISQTVDLMVKMIENISASVEETAASTEETSAATEEQTAALEQISQSTDKLARLAKDLQEMVAKFKI